MIKRTCFVFSFLVIGLFSAEQPYYETKDLPEYKYNPPLVCEIEVPSGIVNGFYVPTHKEMVIVAPGNYTTQEATTSTIQPDPFAHQPEAKEGEIKSKTPILKDIRKDIRTEEVSNTEEETKKKQVAQVVVDTIPMELNKQIDVAFSDVPLKVALGQLAMEYELKFIVANDVPNAQITCFAKGSPLSAVLDDITTQVKATYSYKEGKIMVYVFGTKIFKLTLPNISHYFSSSINTSGYAGFESDTGGSSDDDSSSSSGSEEAGPNAEVKIKVEETKVYDEIESNIKAVISDKGKYGINKSTGTIIVTDYAENLKEAEKVLELVNKEFSKQVSLKVRVVEVGLNDTAQTGINWEYLSKKVQASTAFSLVTTGNTLIFKSTETPSPDNKGITVILNALQEFGKLHIVSQPSLTVLNTQPASIQVGTIKSYISSISQETTDVGILSGTGTSQIAEGLTLALINKINDDGKVYLSLMPTIKEVNTIRSIPVAGGGQIEAPDIAIRALTTSVVAEAGDTVVLGGLIKEEDHIKTQKTPFFGDVPILKYLFSQKTKEKTRSELVIMLTIEGVEYGI